MSAPPADAAPLSADELAVYDRSIRTWGLDVQAKLSAAKVLVVGLPGAACEVAKNVVLAGVGRVDLIDEPGAQAAAGNFLAPHDATGSAAEATAHTLAAMNPFVKVASLALPDGVASPASLPPPFLRQYDVVVVALRGAHSLRAVADAARDAGVKCFAVGCTQSYGFVLSDLLTHAFVAARVKKSEAEEAAAATASATAAAAPGPVPLPPPPPAQATLSFVPISSALSSPLSKLTKRTPLAAVVLRLVLEVEAATRAPLETGDGPKLMAAAAAAKAAGLHASLVPSDEALEAVAGKADEGESPAVAAVVGGVLATEVLKALSGVGEPAHNAFVFDADSGAGAFVGFGV